MMLSYPVELLPVAIPALKVSPLPRLRPLAISLSVARCAVWGGAQHTSDSKI